MATFVFELLADDQQITFNPAADVLEFQTAGIDAGMLLVQLQPDGRWRVHDDAGQLEGKTVFCVGSTLAELTQSNFSFTGAGSGGLVLIGDNTAGTVNDAGSNTLVGSAFGDFIAGLDGNDSLSGGDGDDLFSFESISGGGTGSDTINGGNGSDWLFFNTVPFNNDQAIVIDLGAGTMTGFRAGSSASLTSIENVMASNTNDSIVGSSVDNYIDGFNGHDTLRGAAGNDTLFGYSGDDLLDGGEGIDTAAYDEATQGVVVDLAAGTAADGQGGPFSTPGTDTLLSIENVLGSEHGDLIYGDANANHLDGFAGDDNLRGRAGNDTLVGGADPNEDYTEVEYIDSPSAVIVNLGAAPLPFTHPVQGSLMVQGGTAYDGFGAQASNTDTLINIVSAKGSDFNDTLIGGAGDDAFDGRGGNDSIEGGAGFDELAYHFSPAAIVVNIATSTYQDGWGTNDVVSGIEMVGGSTFNDTITGDAGPNSLRGEAGDDALSGGDGDDTLWGGGDDGAFAGDDTLDGGAGADAASYLWANSGVDVDLATGNASDFFGSNTFISIENLIGTEFDDILRGDANANRIEGSGGFDELHGREGNDTLVGVAPSGSISEEEEEDFAIAVYEDSPTAIIANLGSSDVTFNHAVQGSLTVQGGTVYDGYGAQGSSTDTLILINAVVGSAFNDTLVGGSGDDGFAGAAGADSIDGGAGIDELAYFNSPTGVVINLGTATFQDGFGTSDSASGIENVSGSEFADFLTGDAGANGLGGDLGDDSLVGGDGNDSLYGDSGNDTLDGGAGDDTMEGGSGDDTYIVDSAGDVMRENMGDGFDSIVTDLSIAIPANVEKVKFGGLGFFGDAADNVIEGVNIAQTLGGGDGIDTVSYIYQAAAVTIDLAGGTATEQGGSGAVEDDLFSFENAEGGLANDTLIGTTGSNTLDGRSGADSMQGGSGADIYYVDHAADQVVETDNTPIGMPIALDLGSIIDKVIASIDYALGNFLENLELAGSGNLSGTGNALDNVLTGNQGDNALDGAAGTDTASYMSAAAGVSVSLALAGAQATGGAGSDTLISIENLTGSTFNDTLAGNAADNILDGGAGTDTVSYAAASGAVTVGLHITGPQATGSAGFDTLISFENLIGSAFNDIIGGNTANNTIDGGAGIDTVSFATATGGVFYTLDSPGPHNTGGAGIDVLFNIENLSGSVFNDTFLGNAGANTLAGLGGNDQLNGQSGIDTADYSTASGAVVAELWLGTASNDGQGGADTLLGIENLLGGGFNDLLVGDDGANGLAGGGGDDTLLGGGGADSLSGEAGNDTLRGNAGNDTLNGGDGVDTLDYSTVVNGVTVELWLGTVGNDGEGGADTLIGIENAFGTQANDLLVGTEDANSLFGNTGNDSILGGGGNDSLLGEAGDDTLGGNAGNDTIDGGDGIDTVDYSLVTNGVTVEVWLGTVSNDGQGGADTLFGIENVFGTQSNDLLVGTEDANRLFGNTGNDSILGGGGNDSLLGEGGNDTLGGNAGNDTIDGGDGIDTVDYSLVANGVTVELWLATVSNDGQGGADTLFGIENLFGTQSNDLLVGTEDANSLFGNTGNDSILGGGGNDSLLGQGGDDTISGNAGNDTIDGGDGIDTLDYSTVANGVTVELWRGTVDDDGQGGADTIVGIENAFGTLANDFLVGTEDANALFGNSGNDTVSGGGGADSLFGEGGNDLLWSGTGSDTVSGGAGLDEYLFDAALGATNVDQITDFSVADDTILLYNAIFTSLGSPGALPAGTFVSGAGQSTAIDANDYLIYDNTNGALYYDADGSNSGSAPVQFATLIGTPLLTEADFVVV